jgi:hypothetical protein
MAQLDVDPQISLVLSFEHILSVAEINQQVSKQFEITILTKNLSTCKSK